MDIWFKMLYQYRVTIGVTRFAPARSKPMDFRDTEVSRDFVILRYE